MKLTRNIAIGILLSCAAASAQNGVYAQSLNKARETKKQVEGQKAQTPATQPTATPAQPAAANQPQAASTTPRAGRRDPFVSPVVAMGAQDTPACSSGKRCLSLQQMTVKGIVRSKDGMIALVENSARRSYVLRERDQVFNAVVVRITPESIIFREKVVDNLGRETFREVSKRIPPSV